MIVTQDSFKFENWKEAASEVRNTLVIIAFSFFAPLVPLAVAAGTAIVNEIAGRIERSGAK